MILWMSGKSWEESTKISEFFNTVDFKMHYTTLMIPEYKDPTESESYHAYHFTVSNRAPRIVAESNPHRPLRLPPIFPSSYLLQSNMSMILSHCLCERYIRIHDADQVHESVFSTSWQGTLLNSSCLLRSSVLRQFFVLPIRNNTLIIYCRSMNRKPVKLSYWKRVIYGLDYRYRHGVG